MESEKTNLRRLDFRTGILLSILAVGIIWEATSYPMSDSYGGVQNVWYVSPALFPLLVGGLLLLLSIVLIGNAIRELGWPEILRSKAGGDSWLNERNQRFLAIVSLIATYVYAFIPNVDFYISTALFLFAFITAFYLERYEPLVISSVAFLFTGLLVLTAGRISGDGVSQAAIDIFTTLVLVALCLYYFRFFHARAIGIRRLVTTLLVAVSVPLLLAPVFRFGLLVPLPTEGLYIEAMEQLKYLLRSAL